MLGVWAAGKGRRSCCRETGWSGWRARCEHTGPRRRSSLGGAGARRVGPQWRGCCGRGERARLEQGVGRQGPGAAAAVQSRGPGPRPDRRCRGPGSGSHVDGATGPKPEDNRLRTSRTAGRRGSRRPAPRRGCAVRTRPERQGHERAGLGWPSKDRRGKPGVFPAELAQERACGPERCRALTGDSTGTRPAGAPTSAGCAVGMARPPGRGAHRPREGARGGGVGRRRGGY